jgi:hypothetical protein
VAKAFGREAGGQMAVLDEFEARGWRAKIDVGGLVPKDANAKQWIADVVKNLNRGLTGLRFHADGANQCIAWAAVECVCT